MDICDYAVGLSRMLGGRVMPSESKLSQITSLMIVLVEILVKELASD